MNRKKLAALLIAFSLVLSGCNLITGNELPWHSTPEDSNSQTVTGDDTVGTFSAIPEFTENTDQNTENSEDPENTKTTKSTENTEDTGNTEDTDDTDGTDVTTSDTEGAEESSEGSDSEETTTSTQVTTTTTTSTTTTTTAATTTTKAATTTTTAATTTTTTTTAATTTQPISAQPSPPTIHETKADGISTSATSLAVIDYSHTSDGYVMAKYSGSKSKVKVQITYPSGANYSYDLNTKGNYEAFPLTGGNGSYTVLVAENVSGNSYSMAATCVFNVTLSSATAPYLRPSNRVDFSIGDAVVTKASQLCGGATTTLQKIERIYSWVVENVTYDNALANDVKTGKVTSYSSNPNKIINERKGICFDYAVGIAAMLRSQDIPTQVVFGDVTDVGYHAWVNIYTNETGWVYGAFYFDGSSWRRMDPTIDASSRWAEFINNNSNYYNVRYLY